MTTPAPVTSPALEQLAAYTLHAVAATTQPVLNAVENVYRQIIGQVAAQVVAGSITRLQAAQDALDRLLGGGITGFTDTSGRNWDLASYIAMAVRTTAGRAAIDGYLDTVTANDRDLVIVQAGPRDCPICALWDGKILSVTGISLGDIQATNPATGRAVTVAVYGSVADARAGGWGHPNCRCVLVTYLPGVTKTARAPYDPAAYEAGQRQRAIERSIRSWKQRSAVAVTPEAKAKAARKVRDWQTEMRALLAENPGLFRQSSREQIGQAH